MRCRRTDEVLAAPDAAAGKWVPRKSIRLTDSAYLGGDPFLLTLCTSGRRPLFRSPGYASTALAAMVEAASRTGASLYCAVVMPDHLHAIVAAQADRTPLDTAYCCKRLTTTGLRRLGYNGSLWQRRVHDRGLRCEQASGSRSLNAAVHYILANPVRHGLVPHWRVWPYHVIAEGVAESL